MENPIEQINNIANMDDYAMFDNTIDWGKIDYKTFAKILYMGKIYE